ncbi:MULTISPECIES: dienelactone hydrolase family protein [Streptomyces]|uniref:Dienelactone hydrolase n=1 Tax=Streptomyces thermoviolaceus subsp. thermoviolaceus TaxID=66860 RepID=A0ABX0YR05_STRTL|nr:MULTISPECIES: dienelactone hydrolase family protein [Streptomyces]MCM3265292.1 dienelactone hydrolase family protein [Streptomyces thermoviolaceus]NJP14523.1 dienelactone hydrolase [Streptomyces thermoviolaceus subsp. thermoviolaceus]RSS05229.1 dienelactone hydrolase [Streptomyces sp. WAC00469]WTD49609.1 dienelactone hydrolase family protein [Streptomyces thermoviolaceus]GGV62077.1 dienelactone hydrolase [Streptomyces thermoviolaceus subsp. apingens]
MNIMLFHSTHGLTPAVRQAADRLRAAGHQVWTPDLFEGRTFDSVEEGMAFKDELGKEELLRRAVLAAAPYSERGLVYAGFSLGASIAQTLALGDDKARGLLLLHGTSDIAPNAQVDDLPVQLHVAEPDPFETDDWLSAWYLRMSRIGADVEVYRYAGAGHLYTDPDHPDYDAEAAEATWRVALGFLDGLQED